MDDSTDDTEPKGTGPSELLHAEDAPHDEDLSAAVPVVGKAVEVRQKRDEFIDFVRAFSLMVVVLWHWTFSIIYWDSDGPHATNPIAFTNGLWILTWFFQVMPLFFYVGGFAHRRVWWKIKSHGGGYREFVGSRFKRLAIPALTMIGLWTVIGIVLVMFGYSRGWALRVVLLVLSPLWFLVVYLLIVVAAPLMIRLHEKLGAIVPVAMVAIAWNIDTLRFEKGVEWVEWVNFPIVWLFCHQMGFFYSKLAKGPRAWSWAFVVGGLGALAALVNTNLYPGSMVGIPTEKISNMGPPTLCIVALCCFQIGVIMLLRPWIMEKLAKPRVARANDIMNRFALPVYLCHTTGLALTLGLFRLINYRPPSTPNWTWWAQRPIWIFVPLLCTLPVIWLFGRGWIKWSYRQTDPVARGKTISDVLSSATRLVR